MKKISIYILSILIFGGFVCAFFVYFIPKRQTAQISQPINQGYQVNNPYQAQNEIDKLKEEIQSLKNQKPQIIYKEIPVSQPQSVPQDTSLLKVEKCKLYAEAMAKDASSKTYQEALHVYLEEISSPEPAVKDYYYVKSQLEMIGLAQNFAKLEAERKYQSVYNSQYFECLNSNY
jgi:hypothetical protein